MATHPNAALGPDAEMDFHIVGPLIEWRGPSPYHFVEIAVEDSEDIKVAAKGLEYWGQVPVVAAIGEVGFRTALFPKGGRYLLPIKDAVRRDVGLRLGAEIAASLRVGRD